MSNRARPVDLQTAVGLSAPARGLPRAVRREDVLVLALSIADEEGLSGLTMRRLARELRVSLATVYAVFGSKDELLSGLVDRVLEDLPGEFTDDGAGADPAETVVRMWTAAHERLLVHPAVAHLANAQPLAGQMVFRFWELALARLRDCGLDETQAAYAYTVLRSNFLGFTMLRLAHAAPMAEDQARIDVLHRLPEDLYPNLRASASLLADQLTSEHLAKSLRQILNGLLN